MKHTDTTPAERRACDTFLATGSLNETASRLGIKPGTAAKYIYSKLIQQGVLPLESLVEEGIIRRAYALLEGSDTFSGLPYLLQAMPEVEPYILRIVFYQYVHAYRDRRGREALALLGGGMPPEEAATRMAVSRSTLMHWIGRMVAAGEAEAEIAVPAEDVRKVTDYLEANGRQRYGRMYEAFGGEVSYDAIRLAYLQWCRQKGAAA